MIRIIRSACGPHVFLHVSCDNNASYKTYFEYIMLVTIEP